MPKPEATLLTRREKRVQLAALGYLLFLGGMSLAGPAGILSWGENLAMLDNRQHQIAALNAERDELENLVAQLNPDHVDPDLAGELLRKNLNVMHPDEVVITLAPAE